MKIYLYSIRGLITLIGLSTLNVIYDQYYGFQIANGVLATLSLSFLLVLIYLKINRLIFLWYLLYFVYIIVIGLLIDHGSYYNSLAYLALIFLFVIALPSLNRELSINIKVQSFLLNAIFIITLIFIILNFNVYISEGFFLEKGRYESIMSNPNLTGYLFYLGFSISWTLSDYTKKNTYTILMIFFFLCSIILLPVVTIYIAVFTYIMIVKYLKGSSIYKKLNKLLLLLLLLLFSLFFQPIFEGFESWRFVLSQRDFLYIKSLELIQDKIWFGYGANNWGYLHNQIKNPHNFLLYIALSFGVVGLTIYFSHFIILLKIGFKKIQTYPCKSYFKHMYAQLIVNTLIMLSFVSLPGHYQDSSLWMSLFYLIIINSIVYVGSNVCYFKASRK